MIDYAVFCHEGERDYNEDYLKVAMNKSLLTYGFILADGLGGHGRGGEASKTAVEYVAAAVENTESFYGLFIDECFDKAQEYLITEQERLGCPGAMKTTLTFLVVDNRKVTWGHIGDSRIYFFRDGRLIERTKDHSVVQALLDVKKIKEKDIRRHKERNKLLKAMGMEWNGPEYEIDRRNVKTVQNDTFLLCSDGFWDWIDEKTMARVIRKAENAHEALQDMINIVYRNGMGQGMDNCSAILVRVK